MHRRDGKDDKAWKSTSTVTKELQNLERLIIYKKNIGLGTEGPTFCAKSNSVNWYRLWEV